METEKSNVVDLNCITTLDIPTEKILEAAKENNLAEVIIIGTHEDGEEFFASSFSDGPTAVWMLERAKLELLTMADDDDDDEDNI